MPCYHPIRAYQGTGGAVFFYERVGNESLRTLDLPCGRCIGCRLERSRQWAVRCMHEAQMHEVNCFVTLTYAEPAPVSLNYRDFQLFLKRLRSGSKKKIRFFACGEYGGMLGRPHFHACLFGVDFADRRLHSRTNGVRLDVSPALTACWGLGYATVGNVTFESAGYVARYCLKKVNGDLADAHYRVVDPETGEVIQREPEMCHMSLKPGIGATWLDKFGDGCFPRGTVVANGVEAKAPRYYDKWYRRRDAGEFEEVTQFGRELAARARSADGTNERLAVRERVTQAATRSLKRE